MTEEELEIAVFRRSSGAGISVPTNESVIHIRHIPTGFSAVAVHRSALGAKRLALIGLQAMLDASTSNEEEAR